MVERIDRNIVSVGPRGLEGILFVPRVPRGVIVFAHGSGSSRLSPRNTAVASALSRAGFAALLFDLLTIEEAQNRRNVFDIPLLSERIVEAIDWARRQVALKTLPIGLFGASTGAAAALAAAADRPDEVAAVVSRGGRPDLAADKLAKVKAPTLLIVGERDDVVIELNASAYLKLSCEKKLHIVPNATHLFEEAGTMEEVVHHALNWFGGHLAGNESKEHAT